MTSVYVFIYAIIIPRQTPLLIGQPAYITKQFQAQATTDTPLRHLLFRLRKKELMSLRMLRFFSNRTPLSIKTKFLTYYFKLLSVLNYLVFRKMYLLNVRCSYHVQVRYAFHRIP